MFLKVCALSKKKNARVSAMDNPIMLSHDWDRKLVGEIPAKCIWSKANMTETNMHENHIRLSDHLPELLMSSENDYPVCTLDYCTNCFSSSAF